MKGYLGCGFFGSLLGRKETQPPIHLHTLQCQMDLSLPSCQSLPFISQEQIIETSPLITHLTSVLSSSASTMSCFVYDWGGSVGIQPSVIDDV